MLLIRHHLNGWSDLWNSTSSCRRPGTSLISSSQLKMAKNPGWCVQGTGMLQSNAHFGHPDEHHKSLVKSFLVEKLKISSSRATVSQKTTTHNGRVTRGGVPLTGAPGGTVRQWPGTKSQHDSPNDKTSGCRVLEAWHALIGGPPRQDHKCFKMFPNVSCGQI